MKKILWIGMLVIALCSCEQELMDFEGTDGVYFAVQWGDSWGSELNWPYQPYTNVQFMQLTGDTATVSFCVMTTGQVKSYDRFFRVEVNPDSTTAIENVDYLSLQNEIMIKTARIFLLFICNHL